MTLQFKFCDATLDIAGREVVTVFKDGTKAYATPHETSEYHAHAIEKTGVDDTLLYCWQHEIFHILNGEAVGGPSVVLWNLAHGLSTDTEECGLEEAQVQEFQRALQWPLKIV